MNQKEIRELIEFLIEKDIAEFELERGDVKLRVKRAGQRNRRRRSSPLLRHMPIAAPRRLAAHAPAAPAAPSAIPPKHQRLPLPAAEDESSWLIVKSPIVGTFYGSPRRERRRS